MAFDSKIFWKQTRQANRAINDAAYRLRTLAGQNLQQHTEGVSYELLASLRTQTRRQDGLIYVIKLGMLRYGILREYGAGKGWRSPGTTRRPAPWIKESMEAVMPKLADRLAKIKGDDMVDLVDDEFKKTLKNNYRL